MIHKHGFWVEARIDNQRLAVSALGSGNRADRFIVVPAASMADGSGNWGWVLWVCREGSSSKQTGLAHCTCVTRDASLLVLLGPLLLLSSP